MASIVITVHNYTVNIVYVSVHMYCYSMRTQLLPEDEIGVTIGNTTEVAVVDTTVVAEFKVVVLNIATQQKQVVRNDHN